MTSGPFTHLEPWARFETAFPWPVRAVGVIGRSGLS